MASFDSVAIDRHTRDLRITVVANASERLKDRANEVGDQLR